MALPPDPGSIVSGPPGIPGTLAPAHAPHKRPSLQHRIGQRIGKSESWPDGDGSAKTILQITGDDDQPWMVNGSIFCAYTGGTQSAPALGTAFPEVIATLEFGVDGANHTAYFHVSRGVQFSFPATGIRLSAVRVLSANPIENGPCIVSAQVAYGAHPAGHQQPILEVSTALPANAGPVPLLSVLQIPPFTRAFSLLSDDLGALSGATAVGIEALGPGATPAVLARYNPTDPFDSRPLPQGAAQLGIVQPVGAGVRVVRALFELAL